MSRAKLGKNKIVKISRFLLIFVLMMAWIFSGWPRIWHNPPIPPKIQEGGAELSTAALLTGIFGLFILKIVNPPRAVFGPCGV